MTSGKGVPHPWRCETCKRKECALHPSKYKTFQQSLYYGADEIWRHVKVYGCASHSSATSAEQRIADAIKEQIRQDAINGVLDRIVEWKRKHGYWFRISDDQERYHFEPAAFDEFIKELRQQQAPGTGGQG